MRAFATGVCTYSVICLSVYVLVTAVSPAKSSKPIEMPSGGGEGADSYDGRQANSPCWAAMPAVAIRSSN